MSLIGSIGNSFFNYDRNYDASSNTSPKSYIANFLSASDDVSFSPLKQFTSKLANKILDIGEKTIKTFDVLIGEASKVELSGTQKDVHNQISKMSSGVLSSGIFGNVVTGLLEKACDIGSNIPIIGDIIEPISKMISPEVVGGAINNSLALIEENFFSSESAMGSYDTLKETVLETLSLNNIRRVTTGLIETSTTFAAGVLTKDKGAISEALDGARNLLENSSGIKILEGKGIVGNVIGTIVDGTKNILRMDTIEDVVGLADNVVNQETLSDVANATNNFLRKGDVSGAIDIAEDIFSQKNINEAKNVAKNVLSGTSLSGVVDIADNVLNADTVNNVIDIVNDVVNKETLKDAANAANNLVKNGDINGVIDVAQGIFNEKTINKVSNVVKDVVNEDTIGDIADLAGNFVGKDIVSNAEKIVKTVVNEDTIDTVTDMAKNALKGDSVIGIAKTVVNKDTINAGLNIVKGATSLLKGFFK